MEDEEDEDRLSSNSVACSLVNRRVEKAARHVGITLKRRREEEEEEKDWEDVKQMKQRLRKAQRKNGWNRSELQLLTNTIRLTDHSSCYNALCFSVDCLTN